MMEDGVTVDEQALVKIIEYFLSCGVTSLLASAGTGEVMFIPREAKKRVMEITVKTVNNRVPVAAGVVEITLEDTIRAALAAKSTGVEALLVSTPFGSDISLQGIIDFYRTVDAAVQMPIMIYNYPGRTGYNTTPDVLGSLIDAVPNIVGIKECAVKLDQTIEDIMRFGDRIQIISGNEFLAPWEMLFGAQGCILASPNLLTQQWMDIYHAAKSRDVEKIIKLSSYIFKLQKMLFKSINPGPLKYAMGLMGYNVGKPVTPCVDAPDDLKAEIKAEMEKMNLI